MKWKDRYGIAFGKGLKKTGNVEAHLAYSKLHRTGKLLRNLHSKVELKGGRWASKNIVLGNRVKYAKDHNEGVEASKVVRIKAPYVRGGASTVITGGSITARPFMNPSKKILMLPKTLLGRKLRKMGW